MTNMIVLTQLANPPIPALICVSIGPKRSSTPTKSSHANVITAS